MKALNSKKGSALLIAMILSVFISVLILSLADRVQRFARSSSGIEASTQAYYNTNSTIEKQLMKTEKLRNEPWTLLSASGGNTTSGSGFYLKVATGSTTIPATGQGNSPFSNDYNLISLSEPAQLVIPDKVDWSSVTIEFRVPDLDGNGTTEKLNTTINTLSGVILWTFGSQEQILYASGETNIVRFQNIDSSNPITFDISQKTGYFSSDTSVSKNFLSFYRSNPPDGIGPDGNECQSYSCTLKFSMIRRVELEGGKVLPFLEYKIHFDTSEIPNRYMKLDSSAYVRGYLRSRHVEIPQITTNTALDFAVLQ